MKGLPATFVDPENCQKFRTLSKQTAGDSVTVTLRIIFTKACFEKAAQLVLRSRVHTIGLCSTNRPTKAPGHNKFFTMASQGQVLLLVLCALLPGCSASTIEEDAPTVDTQYGAVRGMYVEEGVIFMGLPFAAPPVGELRFRPPRAYNTSWAPDVHDGTVPPPACNQQEKDCRDPKAPDPMGYCPYSHKFSEDCLYLNIFVPYNVLNSAVRLPVLFWIHGGSYLSDTAACVLYDGRILANKTNTIVVTANYRLGAFGFLVTGQGDDDARGNQGLLDQMEALKWVQQNIDSFGGDKNKVTIFGQSAGADSVATHLISDKSARLFQQAVMMSVPFSVPRKTQREAVRLGKHFAELLNCSHGDMKCLRSKEAGAVTQAGWTARKYIVNPFEPVETFEQWGPTIDNDVVPDQIVSSFTKGNFQRKPIIIGTTLEEEVFFAYDAFQPITTKAKLDVILLGFFREKALSIVREYNPQPSADYRAVLSVMGTDWMVTCPARNVIRSAARGGSNVWLYLFDHVWSFKHLWGNDTFCEGHVCHSEDLPFVFQALKLKNVTMTADEQVMADMMAYHYGNFAHMGDPNKPSQYISSIKPAGVHWPKYSEDNNFTCLNITTPQNVLLEKYRGEKCDFLDKLNVYP